MKKIYFTNGRHTEISQEDYEKIVEYLEGKNHTNFVTFKGSNNESVMTIRMDKITHIK